MVWTCVTTLFVLICSKFMASDSNTHTVISAFAVSTLSRSVLYPLFTLPLCFIVCITLLYFLYCASQTLHTVGSLCACFLVSGTSFLLAMRSLCKWACVLLYLCFSFASFCYVLSLLICTELPTWLLGWFGGYLVTYLHWTGGLLGWCWLPIWLTANAGAVLHHVANHRLLSLRLVWPANTQRQCSGTTPSWQPNVTMQLHVLKPCISLSF